MAIRALSLSVLLILAGCGALPTRTVVEVVEKPVPVRAPVPAEVVAPFTRTAKVRMVSPQDPEARIALTEEGWVDLQRFLLELHAWGELPRAWLRESGP